MYSFNERTEYQYIVEQIIMENESSDIKSMIAKRLEKADDDTLEKILFQLKEELIGTMVSQLAKARNGAVDADKQYIIDVVRSMKGTTIDKIRFLKGCIAGTHLDFSKLVSDSLAGKVLITGYIKDEMALDFWSKTAIKNPKFTLGDATSVGPGEGAIICLAKGVGKADKGDLSYGGKEIEVKAQGARWGSARVKLNSPDKFMALLYDNLKKKYKKLPISSIPSNWKQENIKDIISFLDDNGISHEDFNKAIGEAFKSIYPKATSSSLNYFLKERGNMFEGKAKKYQAAYTAIIAENYKNSDGWDVLMHLNHLKKTFPCISFRTHQEAYNMVLQNKLNPGMWKPGGSDPRSQHSPTYSIPAR